MDKKPILQLPSRPDHRKRLGAIGERIALDHLIGRGYNIIATNYRMPYALHGGEIDIVASLRECLCFIEVKTRCSPNADPAEAVGPAKRRQLIALAEAYLSQHASAPTLVCRFDVVSVNMQSDYSGQPKVTIIENAFWPE